MNNLNCAGLSVLDLYVVRGEHRGRFQINYKAEKKQNKNSFKRWIKGEEKRAVLYYSMKRERRVNPIILVKELFWILSNFKKKMHQPAALFRSSGRKRFSEFSGSESISRDVFQKVITFFSFEIITLCSNSLIVHGNRKKSSSALGK